MPDSANVVTMISPLAADKPPTYASIAKADQATASILRNLPQAYSNGSDVQVREAMAVASSMAGLAFTRAGVGYVHAFAHQMGGLYHVPHGLANAIVMPHVLDYSLPNCADRLAILAREFGMLASVGSDFHAPGDWSELGLYRPLPDDLSPLWTRFGCAPSYETV